MAPADDGRVTWPEVVMLSMRRCRCVSGDVTSPQSTPPSAAGTAPRHVNSSCSSSLPTNEDVLHWLRRRRFSNKLAVVVMTVTNYYTRLLGCSSETQLSSCLSYALIRYVV